MKNPLSLFSLLILASIFANGQNKLYKSHQLTIENGLAHNTVECVFKDSEGYMWFGTHNGLNRYDGSTIKTYQHDLSNHSSISGNKILCINEDNSGNLWIGTSGNGLNKFNKQTEQFTSYKPNRAENSLPSNLVNNINLLNNNDIWICTNNGLAKYDQANDNFRNYFPENSVLDNSQFAVYDIVKTKQGIIYVAINQDYMYSLNPVSGEFTPVRYSRNANLMGNYGKHILEDPNGNIWISAFSHGLVKLNTETGVSKTYTPESSNLGFDLLNGEIIIHKNKLWLPTDGAGIIICDLENESFSSISNNNKKNNLLYSNQIYSLVVDSQDIVWAGTFNEGVNILDPNQFKLNSAKTIENNALSFDGFSILSIFEDSKGRIWLGTDGDGLFQLNTNGQVLQYKNEPNNNNSLSSNRIICINEDSLGNILLGSYMGGLVVFDTQKQKFTRYLPNNNPHSIASTHVWDIFIDSDNRIWIGLLSSGLDQFDLETETFIHYGPNTDNYNRINHGNVMDIIEDKDGDIWFATDGRGVNILDKETRQMYPNLNTIDNKGLSSNSLCCVFEDSEGIIWIGTENGGLNRYDKREQSIEYYSMKDGLPSNIVYSIVEDDNHCLWLGTAYGISKFDKKLRSFSNYDIDDGLQGFVCNRNALIRTNDGSILVGTTNGLNIFHPDSIHHIKYKPDVFFTALRIQNKIVNIGDTINGRVVLCNNLNYTKKVTIEPQDKIFTLEFAAKTYTLPEKCSYKYKLKGFEKEWKKTDATRQHVTYSNLNPGTYIFKVQASNSDGIWSNKITTIEIDVLPSFMQSVWFKLIIALIVLLIFYIWYRNKLQIKEKQFLHEKDLHHQEIVFLEKEKLESELNNQTFSVLSRNRTLLKHKRRLSLLVNKVDEKNRKTLEDIIAEIENEINEDKDWKHIEPRLDKVYNNFMTILKNKHSNLTQTELRIAAYVRMGLSTKEISELLQKTIKAIDNERYRLRKKLDVPLNDSLKGYLLDL
ncbi:MAG: triple tyrosine motif-containing protein [Salinivirgaceae bacterium]|jgi:ligand-binding sensor domain-containing protein/DNA-binding CsgD family transcriptional regulator|nr:triple tyrosine motif-containing protein [Salinivirgaceae bacterium]